MKVYIPDCESPVLLVNRAALNAIAQGATLFIDGHPRHHYNKVTVFKHSNKHYLSLLTSEKSIEDFVVKIGDYSDFLFFYAPCNKCTLCRSSKQAQLVQRAMIESTCYDTPPFFFTLTYSNRHLPSNRDLCYADVQKYFKRLRKYWTKLYGKADFRYIVAGEYGSKYNRPHYHVILFNNPLGASELSPILYRRLRDDLFTRWGMCERQAFDFSQCHGGAAAYVTKYLMKVDVPRRGHCIKPFVHCSCGRGGIGSPLIDKRVTYYRNNPSLSVFEFRSSDGSLQSINFGRYINDRIWPSPTRLVPPKVRNEYKQVRDLLCNLVSIGVLDFDTAFSLSDRFRPFKNVISNTLTPFDCRHHGCCPTRRVFLARRYLKILKSLYRSLYPYTKVLIDEDYITLYRLHKSYIPEYKEHSLGWSKMLKKQKSSQVLQKEYL